MKIRVEIDENVSEEEIIIRCRCLTEEVARVQRVVAQAASRTQRLVFYKGDTEYYLSPDEILFFETDESGINAHTRDNVYQTVYKLYELEELLPGCFMRISKSAILNTNRIYSISRTLGTSGMVQFQNSHKQVYVSRNYYKPLKSKLDEKRLGK